MTRGSTFGGPAVASICVRRGRGRGGRATATAATTGAEQGERQQGQDYELTHKALFLDNRRALLDVVDGEILGQHGRHPGAAGEGAQTADVLHHKSGLLDIQTPVVAVRGARGLGKLRVVAT